MTYEDCKKAVAQKYKLGKTLVTGHLAKYFEEATMMYASQTCDCDWEDVGLLPMMQCKKCKSYKINE